MGRGRLGLGAVCLVVLAACGGSGPAAAAPKDASVDDFCAAKEWFVTQGVQRLEGQGFPPPEDALAELARDWAEELARVGTPENMSAEARSGFEKFVDRIHDMESGDVGDLRFNWGGGDWENEEEKAFAQFVTNTCP